MKCFEVYNISMKVKKKFNGFAFNRNKIKYWYLIHKFDKQLITDNRFFCMSGEKCHSMNRHKIRACLPLKKIEENKTIEKIPSNEKLYSINCNSKYGPLI